MTSRRVVLHADMDAFYASIEQRDDPSLRGKPVIVGAGSGRGVVAAASYEARVFGVRSAMPGFRARALCPDGIFLPSNMAKYASVSDEVHQVFQDFSPDVEPLALDEAFLDVTGSVALFGGVLELGRKLKAAVREKVGLSVSVGIAPSKLVAKLACTWSKPDGLIYVPEEAVTWFLHPLPVRRLWGVGPVMEETLLAAGFRTVGDLARADRSRLERALGDRAHFFERMASGQDDREVEASLMPKSCGEENTFEQDVTDRDVVTAALTSHAEAVARRLRSDGLRGRTVTLKIKLGKARGTRVSRIAPREAEPIYPLLTRSRTLPRATSDGKRIRDIAVELWDAAGVTEPIRLLGVSLSQLEGGEGTAEQLDLFGGAASNTRATPKENAPERAAAPDAGDRLGAALDDITRRFGKGAIRRAVTDPEKITASGRKKRGE